MKLKKQTGLLVAMALVALGLYNAILFLVAGFADHSPAFWISYVSVMLSAAVAMISLAVFSKSNLVVRDWFLGYPILRHTVIYVIIELVLSILFMALEHILPWVVSLVVQLLLLGIYVLLIMSCFFAKNIVEDIGKQVKGKTAFIKLLQADVVMLCELCSDMEAKKKFNELAEEVRYSDPMSSDLLLALEGQIQSRVTEARELLSNGDVEGALKLSSQAHALLKERNLKCKALK